MLSPLPALAVPGSADNPSALAAAAAEFWMKWRRVFMGGGSQPAARVSINMGRENSWKKDTYLTRRALITV